MDNPGGNSVLSRGGALCEKVLDGHGEGGKGYGREGGTQGMPCALNARLVPWFGNV